MMVSAGKIVVRIVFIACMVLILLGDYTGLIGKLLGGNKEGGGVTRPRPTNPGYGETKTEIDLDADIEDETITSLGK